MNKFRNKQMQTPDGKFDSQREYSRWLELKLMQRAGAIQELKRQVKFLLIPTQRAEGKKGKVIEYPCYYIADFVYKENGKTVVEDSKGDKTKDYIIKRKLMLWVHGIRVKET